MKKNTFTKRSDGRYQTSLTDPRTGKRIYFCGKTVSEVKQKIFAYQEKQSVGPLFSEVASCWWEEAEPNLAIQSRRGYRQAKEYAESEFKDIRIREIQPKDITAYLKRLGQEYKSQKTVDRFRLILNLIFKYAIENGELQYNPCSVAKTPKGLTKSKREAANERDEQIIKERTDLWLFPFVAIYTGMRKGEILALQWKDIDFENNLIRVTKSVSHDGNRPVIKEPKTEAGNRFVPLLKPLKEQLLKKEAKDPELFLFSEHDNNPLKEHEYTNLLKEYKAETGITCTAHQLRHSFATIAFENGVDIKTVQEILGHKQITTTMDLYTDFRTNHLKKITEDLNNKIR